MLKLTEIFSQIKTFEFIMTDDTIYDIHIIAETSVESLPWRHQKVLVPVCMNVCMYVSR